MAERFSKERVLEHLAHEADLVERLHKLDREYGTNQLDAGDIRRAVAYGELCALLELADNIRYNRINYYKGDK